MKRVKQTKFGSPDGNCFEACLAAILEIQLDTIPHFREDDWFQQINRWLKWHHGMQMLMIEQDLTDILSPVTYSIASGPGPRGLLHSVVYRGTELAHDPHPDNKGLQSVDFWIIFVALNPSKMPRRKPRRCRS